MLGRDLKIAEIVSVSGQGGFFFDDQIAIRNGARHDGFDYQGQPETTGFDRIRQRAECVSVMLVLSDGDVAHGDCVGVQYPGAGGRESLMKADDVIETINQVVRPLLVGERLTTFRELAQRVDDLDVDGQRIASTIRYGVTQALLDAVAKSQRVTMAEVIRDEYQTSSSMRVVPMFAQSGDDRYHNVEKMILRQVPVLPHGLINNVATKVGARGEIMSDYVKWVRDRVLSLRTSDSYLPRLHFDCYGTIGEAFAGDVDQIATYIGLLGEIASPLALRLEHPMDAGSRRDQILHMSHLRRVLRDRKINVELVVDEWCNTLEDIEAFVSGEAADVIHVKMPDLGGLNNTIEALLFVRSRGLKAYCGGSCTETERSAQISAHVAMACEADQILAKPGMGVDEGLQIVGNEMERVATLVAKRGAVPSTF